MIITTLKYLFIGIFFYTLYYTKTTSNEVIFFSRWLFWVQTTQCYLQNGTFCPIPPFQIVKFDKFLHKEGHFFKTIILSTNSAMLSSKLNILSHNSIPNCQICEIPSQIEVIFFKTIVFSTTNPMLSSKFNVLSNNSVPRSQIWKIPSQIGVIFFKTIILSTTDAMLSSKLNILSHNSIPNCQIWKIPSQAGVTFFQMIILSTNNLMLSLTLNVLFHNSIPSS